MFNIDARPEFTHPVTVLEPADAGHSEQTFQARFRVVDEDEAREINAVNTDGVKDFLRAAIVSLDDIVGKDGKPIAYSAELRDRMLALPYVRLALMRTYTDAITKFRVGN